MLTGVAAAAEPVAVDASLLINDAKAPGNVLAHGMGYDQKRYSPPAKVNHKTVAKLTPAWNLSLDHSADASV